MNSNVYGTLRKCSEVEQLSRDFIETCYNQELVQFNHIDISDGICKVYTFIDNVQQVFTLSIFQQEDVIVLSLLDLEKILS